MNESIRHDMTIEEMEIRRAALFEAATEFAHGVWNDARAGALIEYWVRRELSRYDRRIEAAEKFLYGDPYAPKFNPDGMGQNTGS